MGGDQVKIIAKVVGESIPMRSGFDLGFNEIGKAKASDEAAVLAVSPDGKWYFLWSDSGDGWVKVGEVRLSGDPASLPTWPDPMQTYTFKPWATVLRPTDLKNGADSAYETLVCIPPNMNVKLLAQSPDGHWVFAWSDLGDGWIPKSSLQTPSDLSYLATWKNAFEGAVYSPKGSVLPAHLNMHAGAEWAADKVAMLSGGTEFKVMGKSEAGDWLYVVVGGEDGWVPADKIDLAGDMAKVAVWGA